MSAADRQRRARERRRCGVVVVSIAASFDDRDELVEAGLLSAWADEDPDEVASAIMRAARLWLDRQP